MILFHYTSPDEGHLDSIMKAGRINPTDPNITIRQDDPRNKPPVVWLTDDPDAGRNQHGLGDQGKHRVRFTVDVPGIRWLDWAPAYTGEPQWREAIIATGGGDDAIASWYVFPGAITLRRWVAVHVDGAPFLERTDRVQG